MRIPTPLPHKQASKFPGVSRSGSGGRPDSGCSLSTQAISPSTFIADPHRRWPRAMKHSSKWRRTEAAEWAADLELRWSPRGSKANLAFPLSDLAFWSYQLLKISQTKELIWKTVKIREILRSCKLTKEKQRNLRSKGPVYHFKNSTPLYMKRFFPALFIS